MKSKYYTACIFCINVTDMLHLISNLLDRTNGLSLWIPFQNAASSVTTLYKGK